MQRTKLLWRRNWTKTPPWCDRGCNHNVSLPRVFAGNPGVGRNSGLRDSPLATKQSRQDSRASTTHTDLKKKDTEQQRSSEPILFIFHSWVKSLDPYWVYFQPTWEMSRMGEEQTWNFRWPKSPPFAQGPCPETKYGKKCVFGTNPLGPTVLSRFVIFSTKENWFPFFVGKCI